MAKEHQALLNFVQLLHKAHEGDRPKPFNLFSVLRTRHDEVNLHSRFLAALLDHRDHGTKSRENLRDFAQTVLGIKGQFDWTKSRVQRERDDIDILITLEDQPASQLAIVIENKIYAADQARQLDRYVTTVREMGFEEIHPVYLTLHGDDPSPESLGSMEKSNPESRGRLKCKGYNSDVFQGWLQGCQQRAFDEPALRESIVQYLQLVQELTGTDHKGGYMTALEKLLKQEDNLLRASELAEAMVLRMIDLQEDLWKKITCEAWSQTGLRFKLDAHIGEEIQRYYTPNARNKQPIQVFSQALDRRSRNVELYLLVQLHANRLQWGVVYGEEQEDQSRHKKLIDGLRSRFHCRHDSWWPCVENDEKFALETNRVPPFLVGEQQRQECAQEIAARLNDMHQFLMEDRP